MNKSSPTPPLFPDHSAQLKRVARIKGQVEGVARMIEDRRYCADILVQTAAIRAALKSLEATILEKHIATCVTHALTTGDDAQGKIDELLKLYKRA